MTLVIKHPFVCTIATDPAATAAGKVTPAKWNENLSITQATGKILGRKTALDGATEELSTAEVLELIGTCVRGDVLFRGASAWSRLPAGSAGARLTTQGTGADPTWTGKSVTGQGSAPTAGNDSSQGYEVGSIWITTGGAIYMATSVGVGTATWLKWLTPDEAVPTGTMFDWPVATAPTGYFLCYGQAVSRTTYANLFAVIGTTFGTGDGSTTFNLPDMRGRVSAGLDNMGGTSANRLTSPINGDTLGAAGGAESHTLTEAELASHVHVGITLPASEDDNPDAPLNGSVIGNNLGGGATTYTTGQTGAAGSGSAHNNMQPTLVLAKIIKY